MRQLGTIFGGNSNIWCTTGDTPKSEEMGVLSQYVEDFDASRLFGLTINGKPYMVIAADREHIAGKAKGGGGGCFISWSTAAIVLGNYDEGESPADCREKVKYMADFLMSSGY